MFLVGGILVLVMCDFFMGALLWTLLIIAVLGCQVWAAAAFALLWGPWMWRLRVACRDRALEAERWETFRRTYRDYYDKMGYTYLSWGRPAQ